MSGSLAFGYDIFVRRKISSSSFESMTALLQPPSLSSCALPCSARNRCYLLGQLQILTWAEDISFAIVENSEMFGIFSPALVLEDTNGIRWQKLCIYGRCTRVKESAIDDESEVHDSMDSVVEDELRMCETATRGISSLPPPPAFLQQEEKFRHTPSQFQQGRKGI